MYNLSIKKYSHFIRMPSRHNISMWLSHIRHDERFWPIVAVLAVVTALITFAILAGIYGGEGPETTPIRPFPYNF